MLPNQRPERWGGFGLPSFFNLGEGVTNGRVGSVICSAGRDLHFIPMKTILALLILIFPAVSIAAYTSTPRHPTTYVQDGNGNWTAFATMQSVSNAGGPTKYVTRPVALSAASAGKLARAAMGGPIGFGLLALTAFQNYEWDSANEQFLPQVDPTEGQGYQAGYVWRESKSSCTCGADTANGYWTSPAANAAWCKSTYSACWAGGTVTSVGLTQISASQWNITKYLSTGSNWYTSVLRYADTGQTISDLPPTPLTDTQVGDLVLSDPAVVNDILRDSINRNTWKDEWPELVTALEAVSAALENFYEGDQSNYDETIVDRATDSAPEYGSEFSLEFPAFCSWASVVCTFIDWVMSDPVLPDPVDVPVVETELQEWDSGLGLGSCPAGYTMTYNGQSHTFEYTNICWGAETIFKPILIMLSLISAAYILIGARQ